MRLIVAASGKQIGTDKFISGYLRYDCTPVVSSLEFQCIIDEELDSELSVGSTVIVGDDLGRYKIVKRSVSQSSIIRDGKQIVLGAYIAVIEGSEKLIEPSSKANYSEFASFATILRISGSKLKVSKDVSVINYFCAIGATPTYEIARKLKEEAAVMFLDSVGNIVVKRLSTVMDDVPKLKLPSSDVSWIDNASQLTHELPNYVTLNADGSTIEGSINTGSKAGFYPNLDARRLKNLSTALVVVGTIMRPYSPDLLAGEIILIDEAKKYIILTAVHRFDTGVLGAASVSATKLWLSEVVER